MGIKVSPVPLGRMTVDRVRRSQDAIDRLTKLVNSEEFFLWRDVMRELGKPHTPEHIGTNILEVNALANKYMEGWNACLDWGENIVQVLGGLNEVEKPREEVEVDYGADTIFAQNDPFKGKGGR